MSESAAGDSFARYPLNMSQLKKSRPVSKANSGQLTLPYVADLNRSTEERIMSHNTKREEKKISGGLFIAAAILALFASFFWLRAKNFAQAFFWFGFALLWMGFAIPRLRKNEPIQASQQQRPPST
ncbi:MAG TPA: hypothetical protein VK327_02900 [Candidatus Paceibacterota bacterium]|nr:hypothetical protein [Candidatus Paceibacterota bacterium]